LCTRGLQAVGLGCGRGRRHDLIEQHVDLAAEQIVRRLGQPAIGHVGDIGAGQMIEQKQRQMRDRPDPGAAHRRLAFVCLGAGDGLVEIMDRQGFSGDEHHRRARHQDYRLEIGSRVVGEFLVYAEARRMSAKIAHHHCGAVRVRARPAWHRWCRRLP